MEKEFSPTPEFIAFANEFSEKYKTLSEGVYRSDCREYLLLYFDIGKIATFCRVGKDSGRIEFNRPLIIDNPKITPDFIFYMVIWCEVRKLCATESEADAMANKVYKATGRPADYVIDGWIEQFKGIATPQTRERMKNIALYFL